LQISSYRSRYSCSIYGFAPALPTAPLVRAANSQCCSSTPARLLPWNLKFKSTATRVAGGLDLPEKKHGHVVPNCFPHKLPSEVDADNKEKQMAGMVIML